MEVAPDTYQGMFMKKQSLSWLALLLAVVLSVGFMSCDKDDDDEKNGGGNLAASIIGKWEFTDMEGAGYVVETYSFYADGLYELEGHEGSYSSGGYAYSWEESGTYSLSDNTLILDCQVSTDYGTGRYIYRVKIEGDRLTLADGYGDEDVYYRK